LVAALQAQNRYLRRISACSVIVASLLVALSITGWSREQVPDVIQAKRFEVVNSFGKACAVLGQGEGVGSLSLRDYNGVRRFEAGSALNGGFVLDGYDHLGNRCFAVGNTLNPLRQGTFLEFVGTEGLLQLGSSINGNYLNFFDRESKPVISLNTGKLSTSPVLGIWTPNGNLALGTLPASGLGLSLYGNEGAKEPLLTLLTQVGINPKIEMRESDAGGVLSGWWMRNGSSWMTFSNKDATGAQEALSINETLSKITWTQFKEGGKAATWPPDSAQRTVQASVESQAQLVEKN
jgi:hypothetical protein